MKVLVIGGTRFVGPAVVHRLHDAGHEVTVFHRGANEAALPPGIPHLRGDRRHLADHAGALARLAPDVVLDTVAYTERDAQIAMRVLAGVARRLVVLSSMDVYRAYGRVKGCECQ